MQLPNHEPSPDNSSASLPPSTSGSKPTPPYPVTTSKIDSEHNRAYSKPCESWETAYLFAFIYKFTSLCHTLETGLKLRTVQDLEQILGTDTRTTQSETNEEPDSNITNAKEILTEILITFHDNLKTLNANSWSKWLKKFVEEIIKYETQKPLLSILKWPQNYLNTRPNGFWDLDWFDKVHLLRILVDHQLTHSAKIRSIIDENYDKSSGKIIKQPSTPSTSNKVDSSKTTQNQLLIKPLGLDRNLKTWWQIDDSPRIYGSGNPYKADCTWEILSTNRTEFAELMNKLSVDPEVTQKKQSSDSNQPNLAPNESNLISKKVTIPAIFTNNRKKKQLAQNATWQLECELSNAITEIALHNIEAGEKRVQQLLEEKEKIAARELKKQRKIAQVNSQAHLTRETPGFGVRSRLRSQLHKPDYVVDSDEIDRQLERAFRVSEGSKNESSASGRKGKVNKRKRKGKAGESQDSDSDGSEYQTGSLACSNEADDTTGVLDDSVESDRPARKRGTTGARKISSTVQGERRSMRVLTKLEMETEEDPKPILIEEEPQPQASIWSRSKPPTSPPISDSLEEPSTDPTQTNNNLSVWSRGKLIYAAGKNQYASKPGVPSNQDSKTVEENSESEHETKGTNSNGLSALQARLATIGGVDDDENSLEYEKKEEIVSADNPNRGEPSRLELNHDQINEPSHRLTEVDAQPPVCNGSPVPPPLRSSQQLIQPEQDNHPAPSPAINSDQNKLVDSNRNTEPGLSQHRNPAFLSSIV